VRLALVDRGESPFDSAVHCEVRQRVEAELREVPEPYRTTLVLRDLEEMSYEEIADVLEISLGTVKSRLTRGRAALKRRLSAYVRESGAELGLNTPQEEEEQDNRLKNSQGSGGSRRVEVTS
jgi:RNA polymerase sigma-70 factor (ECF subfamily)